MTETVLLNRIPTTTELSNITKTLFFFTRTPSSLQNISKTIIIPPSIDETRKHTKISSGTNYFNEKHLSNKKEKMEIPDSYLEEDDDDSECMTMEDIDAIFL